MSKPTEVRIPVWKIALGVCLGVLAADLARLAFVMATARISTSGATLDMQLATQDPDPVLVGAAVVAAFVVVVGILAKVRKNNMLAAQRDQQSGAEQRD